MKKISLLLAALLGCGAARAGAEVGAGVGVVGLGALGGQVHWQQPGGHWRAGFLYGRVPDYKFEDPFTGRPLTLEKESFFGPFVNYQFKPGRDGRWYAGAELLRWWRKEKSLDTGEWDSDSTANLYIGFGYLRRFGQRGFYDLGLFVAPWARQRTATSVSSTENEGSADLRINVGLIF